MLKIVAAILMAKTESPQHSALEAKHEEKSKTHSDPADKRKEHLPQPA